MTTDFQFYPTPLALGRKAAGKFKEPIRRLLEPSAGNGDLIAAMFADPYEEGLGRHSIGTVRHQQARRRGNNYKVDCIEIDLQKHSTLREQGCNIVGHDFLTYQGAAIYSHILMNPPFAVGAEHVLHAWNLLYDGELVAILNAETVRNPYTRERQLLARIIEQHSSSEPEYLREAFSGIDAERKTDVEVVIIHLRKKGDFDHQFIKTLKRDQFDAAVGDAPQNAVTLPGQGVKNQVIAFNMAVQALRESVVANVRSSYYLGLLGATLAELKRDGSSEEGRVASAADAFNEGYQELKERAWTSILRSTDVTSRLSSGAQSRLEADFQSICQLEFTVQNVYAFLAGLIEQQGTIQSDMLCDVFDLFSTYHDGNRVYYQGWKSNSKHRTYGLALKTTRIVLPAYRRDWYDGWTRSLSWEDSSRFADIDKAFAMLDGKSHEAVFGLNRLFANVSSFKELKGGERKSCDYFDVRFFPDAGTFHLFPRRKDLVDRLNRVVGKQRQWLPPEDSSASKSFWAQCSDAERINKAGSVSVNTWRMRHGSNFEKADEQRKLQERLEAGCKKAKVNFDGELEYRRAIGFGTDGCEAPAQPVQETLALEFDAVG